MKKAAAIIFVFVISVLFSVQGHAQTAKDAFLALKKMEARLQAGLSIRDYSSVLGEVKFPVNLYLEGPEANDNIELSDLIKTIMKHYDNIGIIRKKMLDGSYRYLDSSRSMHASPEFNIFLKQYPEANKFIEAGGAIDRDKSDAGKDLDHLKYGPVLNLKYLLPIVEKTCSEDLNKLSDMFALAETKAKDNKINIENLKKENDYLKAENSKLQKENAVLKAKQKKK